MKFLFSLGLSSAAEAEKLLPMIKEAGFDGIEPTLLPEGFPCIDRCLEEAERLKRIADGLELQIPSMRGGPVFWSCFSASDPDLQEQAVRLLDKAARTLLRLGGSVLLVVPGKYEPHDSYTEVYQRAAAMAERAAEIARHCGITIGLENVHNRFLLSPSEWRRFLDGVNRPEIRCYYDVGNTVYSGLGDPSQWILELGRDRICRIHVKDVTRAGEIVPLLQGDMEWPNVTRSLAQIGYDDWIGVELPLPQEDPLLLLHSARMALREIWSHSSNN